VWVCRRACVSGWVCVCVCVCVYFQASTCHVSLKLNSEGLEVAMGLLSDTADAALICCNHQWRVVLGKILHRGIRPLCSELNICPKILPLTHTFLVLLLTIHFLFFSTNIFFSYFNIKI